jgi:hypothetical protein
MKRLYAITTIALARKVDSKGIDVLRKWSYTPKAPKRPVLTPLKGSTYAFKTKTAQMKWTQEFEGNIHYGLVGIRNTPGKTTVNSVPSDLEEFKNKWEKARPSQRVFISFTKLDFEHAIAVKQALDDQGYTTFIFLDKANGSPIVTAKEAGYFFATAENHFLIDTKNARRSRGVWFERALLGKYGKDSGDDVNPGRSQKPPPSPPPSGKNSGGDVNPRRLQIPPSDPPSPKIIITECTCYIYRNGILVKSFKILPGAMCGKRRCK